MPRAYGRHSHDTWRGVWSMLFFGAFGLTLIFASAPQQVETTRVAQLASVALTGDGATAMFPSPNLIPGTPVSRCIKISYSGAPGGSEVRFEARNLVAATPEQQLLLQRLDVVIERGTGGSFANCAGFAGTSVYAGTRTLADLATGVGTGWTPTSGASQVFRVTITLRGTGDTAADSLVAGENFSADLVWGMERVGAVPAPPPTTAPPTTPPTTAPPTTEPTVDPPVSVPTTVPPTDSPVSAPPPDANPVAPVPSTNSKGSGTPAPSPSATAAPGADPADPADPDAAAQKSTRNPVSKAVASLREGVASSVKAIAAGAKATGKVVGNAASKPYAPAGLGVMFLFLLLQDRLDRRDPKLAMAPVLREPYLIFADPATDAE